MGNGLEEKTLGDRVMVVILFLGSWAVNCCVYSVAFSMYKFVASIVFGVKVYRKA